MYASTERKALMSPASMMFVSAVLAGQDPLYVEWECGLDSSSFVGVDGRRIHSNLALGEALPDDTSNSSFLPTSAVSCMHYFNLNINLPFLEVSAALVGRTARTPTRYYSCFCLHASLT